MLSGPDISIRIADIYDEHYQQVAEDKYIHIIKSLKTFYKSYPLGENFTYKIDNSKIRSLVESYYLDIIRYKEYHFNPKIPRGEKVSVYSKKWASLVHEKKVMAENKVASLTLKWFEKYQPVNIFVSPKNQDYEPSEKEKRLLRNSSAVFSMSHCIELTGVNIQKVPDDLNEDLLYHLLYRPVDESHFYIIFGEMMDNYK